MTIINFFCAAVLVGCVTSWVWCFVNKLEVSEGCSIAQWLEIHGGRFVGGCGPMQLLRKLVAFVVGGDTGGGGDGRVVAVGGAVLQYHDWEAAVAINDNDNEKY